MGTGRADSALNAYSLAWSLSPGDEDELSVHNRLVLHQYHGHMRNVLACFGDFAAARGRAANPNDGLLALAFRRMIVVSNRLIGRVRDEGNIARAETLYGEALGQTLESALEIIKADASGSELSANQSTAREKALRTLSGLIGGIQLMSNRIVKKRAARDSPTGAPDKWTDCQAVCRRLHDVLGQSFKAPTHGASTEPVSLGKEYRRGVADLQRLLTVSFR